MALDENENKYDHLEELGDSDFEIADGEPDIIGWDVKTATGQKIGEVDELLFDPETRKVRYLVVDLANNDIQLDEDKKVLVPIGIATLYDSDMEETDEDDDQEYEEEDGVVKEGDDAEEDDEYVKDEDIDKEDETSDEVKNTEFIGAEHHPEYLESEKEEEDEEIHGDNDSGIYSAEEDGDVVILPVTVEQLKFLPAYEKGNLTPETESAIRQVFEGSQGAGSVAYNHDDFYEHDHFNDDRFYDRNAALPAPATTEAEDHVNGYSSDVPAEPSGVNKESDFGVEGSLANEIKESEEPFTGQPDFSGAEGSFNKNSDNGKTKTSENYEFDEKTEFDKPEEPLHEDSDLGDESLGEDTDVTTGTTHERLRDAEGNWIDEKNELR